MTLFRDFLIVEVWTEFPAIPIVKFYYPMAAKHQLFQPDETGKREWVDLEGNPLKMDAGLTNIYEGATRSAMERLGLDIKQIRFDVSEIYALDPDETIKEMNEVEKLELMALYTAFQHRRNSNDNGKE